MLNVLTVDDDEVTQFHVSQLLLEVGRCRMAYTGEEAIARVEESLSGGEPYDLILMDVMLPGLDGLATVREIVTLYNEQKVPLENRPKIVMLSSVDERETQIDALYACGADFYLTKPLENERFIQALREMGLVTSRKPE
ncbi:MAG: response regulator [Desulfovibrio sp.]|nr:response regulator [Desulfovibrio sp.]MBI4961195.1 response regulator [Desulfovibrio sp.]